MDNDRMLTDDENFDWNSSGFWEEEPDFSLHHQISCENGRTGLGLVILWREIMRGHGIGLPPDFARLAELVGDLFDLMVIVIAAIVRQAIQRPRPPPQAASLGLPSVTLSPRLLPTPAARA